MQAVASAVKTPWKELYLDIRSTPDGTSRAAKLRVIPLAGPLILVPISGPVSATIQEIWKMRDACFSPPWFGMKMTITSQGAVDVDFNYDPTCTSDPAFRAN